MARSRKCFLPRQTHHRHSLLLFCGQVWVGGRCGQTPHFPLTDQRGGTACGCGARDLRASLPPLGLSCPLPALPGTPPAGPSPGQCPLVTGNYPWLPRVSASVPPANVVLLEVGRRRGLRPGVKGSRPASCTPTSPGPACSLGCAAPELITLLQASMPYLPRILAASNSRPSQRPPKTQRCLPWTQRCSPRTHGTPGDPETPQDSETSPLGPRYLPVSPGLRDIPRTQRFPGIQGPLGPRESPPGPQELPGQSQGSGPGSQLPQLPRVFGDGN